MGSEKINPVKQELYSETEHRFEIQLRDPILMRDLTLLITAKNEGEAAEKAKLERPSYTILLVRCLTP
jgi:hypothetical protein